MQAALVHAPLTCSLAARIAATEGHVDLEVRYLNLKTKAIEGGGSLFDFNPLGQVSVLRLPTGETITETSTVLTWIQTQSTDTDFRRDPSDPQNFQVLRWIAFCATELHKQIYRVLFYSEATDAVKDRFLELVPLRFELLNRQLSGRAFLLGDTFSAADAYLTWFFVLTERARLDASPYEHLAEYSRRVLARPLVGELVASDRRKDQEIKAGP